MLTDDKEITITDLIIFLKKYFLVIFFAPISISLISYFGSALLPKYYGTTISFFTNTGSSKSSSSIPAFVMGGMGNPLDSFKKNDSNFVDISELLNSKRLLVSVAEKENLKDLYNTKTNKAAAGKLRKDLSYSIDEESLLEKLSFKSKDPVKTKKVLDTTFLEIELLNDEIVSKSVQVKVKFFEDKIKETIEKLNESEALIYSSKFKDQAFLSLDPKNELGIRARAYEQIRTLESELEVKKNIYGEESKLIQQLRSKIEVLEKNSNLKPIDKEKIENLKEWREIYRDYLYYSAALRSHINNFEVAKLEEAGGSFLTILDHAEILKKPNLPKRKKIFIYTFILSFLLTGCLLIAYEYFVRLSDEDKRKILGE